MHGHGVANAGDRGIMSSVDRATSRASIAALLIMIVAVATRIVSWWNPVAHVDDQFYLLGGQELLRGHWPYIDIWDRKPLGLFVIYAGVAAVGGGSVLILNLIATVFAASTAWVMRQIALRTAGPAAALMGALTYLIVLPLYGGQNGQSPVFYNLLIAAAVLLLIRAAERDRSQPILPLALISMLLCGLAMTVKPTSFVEGGFVGLGYLWLLWRRKIGFAQITALAAVMIAVALLPTLLCFLPYWLKGPTAADAYVYANYVSIFERRSFQLVARLAGAALLLLYLFPLMIMAAIGGWKGFREQRTEFATWLALGWMAAAALGYLTVPAFFDHYALPMLLPLCVLAASFFDGRSGRLWFVAYALFCLIQGSIVDWTSNRAEARAYDRIRATVEAARAGGCIYVFDGPSRLYIDFPQCRPTKYLFPDHIALITEANAVGTDTVAELGRILDKKPAVIITRKSRPGRQSAAIKALLDARLAQLYRPVLRTPAGGSKSVHDISVWQRRDLLQPAVN